MKRYHISKADGMVRACSAQTPESCTAERQEGLDGHYGNIEAAQQDYESYMENSEKNNSMTKLAKEKGLKIKPLNDRDLKTIAYQEASQLAEEDGGTEDEIQLNANIRYHLNNYQLKTNDALSSEAEKETPNLDGAKRYLKEVKREVENLKKLGKSSKETNEANSNYTESANIRYELLRLRKTGESSAENLETLRKQAESNITNENMKKAVAKAIDKESNNYSS